MIAGCVVLIMGHYSYDKKAIAERIRTVRKDKGYSQEYLSFKLKMSQNAYSKIEQGITGLTLVRAIAIAELLDTGLSELLTGTFIDLTGGK